MDHGFLLVAPEATRLTSHHRLHLTLDPRLHLPSLSLPAKTLHAHTTMEPSAKTSSSAPMPLERKAERRTAAGTPAVASIHRPGENPQAAKNPKAIPLSIWVLPRLLLHAVAGPLMESLLE